MVSPSPLGGEGGRRRRTGEGLIPSDIRERAQIRLNAIQGVGAIGPRIAFLASRFSEDATDPKMIVPMIGASLIGRLAGTAALGRWISSPAAMPVSATTAKFASGVAAYLLEFPAFAGFHRLLSGPSPDGFGADLERSALVLGALKLSGGIGTHALQRLHGFNEFGLATRFQSLLPTTSVLLPQSSIFFGMLASHKIEEGSGLRPHVDGATTVIDTLASMVSMEVGSHLGRKALGPSYARLEQELNFRTEMMAKDFRRLQEEHGKTKSEEKTSAPAFSTEGPRPSRSALRWIRSPLLAPVWMVMGAGGLGGVPGSPGAKSDASSHSLTYSPLGLKVQMEIDWGGSFKFPGMREARTRDFEKRLKNLFAGQEGDTPIKGEFADYLRANAEDLKALLEEAAKGREPLSITLNKEGEIIRWGDWEFRDGQVIPAEAPPSSRSPAPPEKPAARPEPLPLISSPLPPTERPFTPLDESIGQSGMSTRVIVGLRNANIRSWRDLIRWNSQDLSKTKNFGPRSLAEVKAFLAAKGLALDMTEEQIAEHERRYLRAPAPASAETPPAPRPAREMTWKGVQSRIGELRTKTVHRLTGSDLGIATREQKKKTPPARADGFVNFRGA